MKSREFEVVTVRIENATTIVLQREKRVADCIEVPLSNGVSLPLVRIVGGSFLMGTPSGEIGRSPDEGPQHIVQIRTFLLGQYPVTQSQYMAVMGTNPSFFRGDNRPVENVSWYEAMEFCSRLSQMTGRNFRLPTEAEWEYACRAGTTESFCFGGTITSELANYKASYGYGVGGTGKWRQETTEVGSFPANHFGLYDMHGNVWEWCLDHWHENYEGAPTDGSAWLEDEEEEGELPRVIRGGSWDDTAYYCRSGVRLLALPEFKGKLIGFRVACDYNE
ncbi:MAG: formylglycine-generating enzyme family protein [Geminocystis sp.]|nr:formylglycine-generating enzyme family protein [Geminocystis sp.]HIK37459.1 formylglycine-generating enzyme family protein [Geminocystis sp. M7585_C2015_104]MCS7147045.1 formylglycine-generating enzyme family protein [Geminocystis sp.]MCX8079307.1 formylglycine-generating enzyme family protein [Geminocystis sp.]MDW8115868.1 formylglycine-generating enzyme family protein [Geminocystis sp.]